MKRCARCGTVKPRFEFNLSSRNRDGRHAYCRSCQADHYRRNKARHVFNVRRTSRERLVRYRRFLAERLAAGCVDCGTRDIRVLEFDHVQGTKVASVSRLVLNASLERLMRG